MGEYRNYLECLASFIELLIKNGVAKLSIETKRPQSNGDTSQYLKLFTFILNPYKKLIKIETFWSDETTTGKINFYQRQDASNERGRWVCRLKPAGLNYFQNNTHELRDFSLRACNCFTMTADFHQYKSLDKQLERYNRLDQELEQLNRNIEELNAKGINVRLSCSVDGKTILENILKSLRQEKQRVYSSFKIDMKLLNYKRSLIGIKQVQINGKAKSYIAKFQNDLRQLSRQSNPVAAPPSPTIVKREAAEPERKHTPFRGRGGKRGHRGNYRGKAESGADKMPRRR